MILQLQNICFSFSGNNHLLDYVSLSLEEKKVYALMGSNGTGKTTLFNLINGFIKLQNGKIIFNGKDITNKQPFKINRLGIGRTFQDLRLITKLTVKENVILAMKNNPSDNCMNAILPEYFGRETNRLYENKADEIVGKFFISDVINSLASDISYGQQKLLTLACCVANGAKLLLLDEVVAGVQPEYRRKIGIIIKQLKEEGKTIFLIEHNTDFIADASDKIFFLHEGKISVFNNMETLRNNKQVMEAYI